MTTAEILDLLRSKVDRHKSGRIARRAGVTTSTVYYLLDRPQMGIKLATVQSIADAVGLELILRPKEGA